MNYNTNQSNDRKVKSFIKENIDEIKKHVEESDIATYTVLSHFEDMFFMDFPKNRMSFSDFEVKFLNEINKMFGTHFSRWTEKDDEPLTESVNAEYETLIYDDLNIVQSEKTYSNDRFEYPYRDVEKSIYFEYEVDKNDIINYLYENHWEDEGLQDYTDEEVYQYVVDHYDELLEKYYDDVLDYFEEDAAEYASEWYDEDDYYESLKESKEENELSFEEFINKAEVLLVVHLPNY